MEKKVISITVGLLMFGATALFADGTAKEESAFQQIASIQKRGIVNFATTPGEFVATFKNEKKAHPKAWPATYVPRVFANMVTRVASSVHDLAVLPWYVRASHNETPLTRRFDMPDYAWENE